MYNSKGKRLKEERLRVSKSQTDFSKALKIKGNRGISLREADEVDITLEEAKILEKEFGVRAIYIMEGEDKLPVVNDGGGVGQASPKVVINEGSINQRFLNEVKRMASYQGLLSQDIAGALNTSPSQWTQVKSGAKMVTPVMLANAVVNLGVDANMVLAGVDTRLHDVNTLKVAMKKCEEENELLKLTVSLLKEKLNIKDEGLPVKKHG
jgi:transcriptional regulator with XRE-family HTH domain